jgi:hypothetical protein
MSWSYFSKLPKIYRFPLIGVGMVVLGVVFFAVFGYVVMWLWNHTLTTVFAVPAVTFWQALGLFVLAKLFFGFGGASHGGGSRRRRHKKHRKDELFKQYWREEGKQAYEAYLAGREPNGAPDERA